MNQASPSLLPQYLRENTPPIPWIKKNLHFAKTVIVKLGSEKVLQPIPTEPMGFRNPANQLSLVVWSMQDFEKKNHQQYQR